jgi:surface polysaccharide O-acyltransferase-like enzyme
LIPFVIWCSVYAFYYYEQGTISLHTALINIAKIPVNYGTDVGHLWFVYMLMAIYLIAPVFSTVDRIGKPQEHGTLPGVVGCERAAALH